jgi:hypothetical protein
VLSVGSAKSGSYKYCSATGVFSSLDISGRVTDKEAARIIQSEAFAGLGKHADVGLAAITRTTISRISVRMVGLRVMRTIADGVEVSSAFVGEHLAQALMNSLNIFIGAQPASHNRLIGYHDSQDPSVVQRPDGCGSAGNQYELIFTMEKVDFFIDHAVTVQKDCLHVHRSFS